MDSPAAFHAEAVYQGRCANCRRVDGEWHAHHVIEKQRCRIVGAPRYDPDNCLRLCSPAIVGCHHRHTQAQQRVPLSVLRDENIAFAVRALGPGPAFNYLTGYYAGTDPRVSAILTIA